jgi:hypothetical protein
MRADLGLAILLSAVVLGVAAPAAAQQLPSRYVQPATGAAARILAEEEARAIGLARRTVVEMQALARTPEEQAGVQRTAAAVEALAAIIGERRRLRAATAGTADAQALRDSVARFELQYLRLQSAMQHENRSYTAVSNIMKTKHDTVKNTISNVR